MSYLQERAPTALARRKGGGVKMLYLIGWFITRFAFLCFWLFAEPLGEANVWFKEKYLAY